MANEPRGWVVRLGAYLRIFGPGSIMAGNPPRVNEALIEKAKQAEAQFGRRRDV